MTRNILLAAACAATLAMYAPPKDQGAASAPAPLTGEALLKAIAAGEVTRITKEQAATLNGDHFQVNTADVDANGGALVILTDAGVAAAGGNAQSAAPAVAASSSAIEIDTDVAMPADLTRRRSPRETLYPFDKLEVGQSFHVAKTAENPEPAVRLSSSVSGAHIRFSPVINGEDGKPVMESYTVPVYQAGPDGKGYAKDADGKRIKTGEETKQREKRGEPTRKFRIVPVDASDKRGEGARVFRVA